MSVATNLTAPQALDADGFLQSVDMKVGAYTLDATTIPVPGARHVTLGHTAVGTADTLGTVTIVGKNLAGETITEVLTPVSGTTVTGAEWFASLISATGAGWVIDAVEATADTIVIGYGADSVIAIGSGTLERVIVAKTAAGTVVLEDIGGTIATLKASIVEGSYEFGVPFSGYLTATLGAASDVTVVHSGSLPQTYAMA